MGCCAAPRPGRWREGGGEAARGAELENGQRIGEKVGLAFGTAFLCEQGKPFSHGSLSMIREASGFTDAEFAKRIGPSTRQVATIEPGRIVRPSVARQVIAWRDGLLCRLLAEPERRSYRKDAALKSLVPQLSEASRFLLAVIAYLRKEARKHPEWTADDLGKFLCVQAQLEKACKPGDDWQKALGYFAAREDAMLEEFLRRARGPELDGPLIRWLIGSRWGANTDTVQNAMRERCQTIVPHEMLTVILRYGAPAPEPKGIGGRKKLERDETRDFKLWQTVRQGIPEMQRGVAILRKARKGNPPVEAIQKSALTKAGFNAKQIEALMQSDNAIDAAQRYAALLFTDARHPNGLSLKTVQNACSECGKPKKPRK